MATAVSSIDEDVNLTVMALREKLMEYFKGGCVESVVYCDKIAVLNLENYQPRGDYQYQRRALIAKKPRLVMLSKVPLFSMAKVPDTVTFHEQVLNRSVELQQVYAGLGEFMQKYLPGVQVKVNRERVTYNAHI